MSYACMPVLQKKLKWSMLYFQMEKTSSEKISTHCQRRKRFSQTLKRRQKKRMNDCAVSWTNLARKQDWKSTQSPKLWINFFLLQIFDNLMTARKLSHKWISHSSPPVLKLGRLCNALMNFSSVIPEAWIINRGWSLNTRNTLILLVFNHPVDCLVQAVYFCSGQNSKLWTMGQECQSSKET